MKYKVIKKIFMIVILAVFLILTYMLPRYISEYNNSKLVYAINEIEYNNNTSIMEELPYSNRLKMLGLLAIKNNQYASLDNNIQVITNENMLQTNEMSLEQIVAYVKSQIDEFRKTHVDINFNTDYSKSTIESKYIRVIDKIDEKNSMGLWDITFKNSIDDYLNIVIDTTIGKIYSINLTSSSNLPAFDYKKIYLEYREYLNLSDNYGYYEQIIKDMLRKYNDINNNQKYLENISSPDVNMDIGEKSFSISYLKSIK